MGYFESLAEQGFQNNLPSRALLYRPMAMPDQKREVISIQSLTCQVVLPLSQRCGGYHKI